MDKQKIFDKAAKHLLTQNARALRKSEGGFEEGPNACAYQNDAGLRCAIGALIPDNHPALQSSVDVGHLLRDDDEFDRSSYPQATGPFPDLVVLWGVDLSNEEDIDFLRELQQIHDDYSPEHWQKALQCFAKQHSLDESVLS